MEVAIHESCGTAAEKHVCHFLEIIFQAVVQVPQNATAVELSLRVTVGEVHAVGSGKLHGGQQAHGLTKQLLLLFIEYACLASFFDGVEQKRISQIFLQIVNIVFGTDKHFGHGQSFSAEMLCHIEKGTVFLNGFAAYPYQRRRTFEAEIAAV